MSKLNAKREICRARKLTSVRTEERRAYLKQKLSIEEFTP